MSTPSPESVPEDVRNAADLTEDALMIARHILIGHSIGIDLGPERKGRLVLDIARQVQRLIDDERQRAAEHSHYHNHFLKHSRVSIAGGIAYDTAKEDWEKRMREGA